MGVPPAPELDLNLVASIIRSAGPASTSFIEVFKAYNDVLQACGLDPADDVVYYRFILKLGSIPGGNWGERWARWLSDSRELASSSSARSSPVLGAREHLADSISGTEYDDEDEQASQSAVGYGMAGSQAGPFSTRSLSPPLRTSTPLARRRPPPRPSSVVHQQPRLHEPTPRRLGQGPAHMLAASPPPPPPPQRLEPLPKRISQSRAAIEEELRREDEERARQREDERQADVFYDIGLMGRCWDVWRKGREWVTTTAAQIDQARAFLLLGSTLAHWRKVMVKHQSLAMLASQLAARSLMTESIHTWVDAHRARQDALARVIEGERRATEGKTWLRWRTKWDDRRKARWQHSLSKREQLVRNRQAERLQRETFARWRDAQLGRVADDHRARELLRSGFQRWVVRRASQAQLRARLEVWEAEARENVLQAAFSAWRGKTRRQEAEGIVSLAVGRRLLRDFLGQWQAAAAQSSLAKDVRRKALLKTGLGVLKRGIARKTALAQVADRFADRTITREWFLEWRARLLRTKQLQQTEAVARAKSEQHFLFTFVSHWRARLGRMETARQAADDKHGRAVQARAFAKWTAECVKHGEQLSLMQSFRDVHLEGLVRKMLHRWVARKRESQERKAADHARRERERVDFLRVTFRAWTDKLKEARLRDIESDVVALRQRNILDRALFAWESRATLAIALHFDKVRRKRATFARLRAELPKARERNRAARVERTRVLHHAYGHWLARTRAKVASRPPPRLKGISRARPRLSGGGGFADAARRATRATPPP